MKRIPLTLPYKLLLGASCSLVLFLIAFGFTPSRLWSSAASLVIGAAIIGVSFAVPFARDVGMLPREVIEQMLEKRAKVEPNYLKRNLLFWLIVLIVLIVVFRVAGHVRI